MNYGVNLRMEDLIDHNPGKVNNHKVGHTPEMMHTPKEEQNMRYGVNPRMGDLMDHNTGKVNSPKFGYTPDLEHTSKEEQNMRYGVNPRMEDLTDQNPGKVNIPKVGHTPDLEHTPKEEQSRKFSPKFVHTPELEHTPKGEQSLKFSPKVGHTSELDHNPKEEQSQKFSPKFVHTPELEHTPKEEKSLKLDPEYIPNGEQSPKTDPEYIPEVDPASFLASPAKPKQECPECGKFLANVNEHLKSVHWKIKNYACKSCTYRACFKNDLMKHVKSKHCHDGENAGEFINVVKMLKQEHVSGADILDKSNLSGTHEGNGKVKKEREEGEGDDEFEDDDDDGNEEMEDLDEICMGRAPVAAPEKKSQCPQCHKFLVNVGEHVKAVHQKEKCYFCSLCNYQTMFKSDLAKHDEAVHRKIRKSCPECGKQVANPSEHIRLVHRKEKKFSCNYCGYMCAKQSDMKKHTKNVHKLDLV